MPFFRSQPPRDKAPAEASSKVTTADRDRVVDAFLAPHEERGMGLGADPHASGISGWSKVRARLSSIYPGDRDEGRRTLTHLAAWSRSPGLKADTAKILDILDAHHGGSLPTAAALAIADKYQRDVAARSRALANRRWHQNLTERAAVVALVAFVAAMVFIPAGLSAHRDVYYTPTATSSPATVLDWINTDAPDGPSVVLQYADGKTEIYKPPVDRIPAKGSTQTVYVRTDVTVPQDSRYRQRSLTPFPQEKADAGLRGAFFPSVGLAIGELLGRPSNPRIPVGPRTTGAETVLWFGLALGGTAGGSAVFAMAGTFLRRRSTLHTERLIEP